MSVTFDITTTFDATYCIVCGEQFALTESRTKALRRSHDWFYCPNGCRIHFTGETQEQRLRRELTEAQDEGTRLSNNLERANRSRAALRGQVTKIKRRIGKGVCPCCRRQFANLRRHMGNKHPDWSEEVS